MKNRALGVLFVYVEEIEVSAEFREFLDRFVCNLNRF